MATQLAYSITAQDTPTGAFTAYQSFVLAFSMSGTNVVTLERLFGNDTWVADTTTFNATGIQVIEVPEGGAGVFRLQATTFDTNPISAWVEGKLNANDTIGGSAPLFALLDEAGTNLLTEASEELLSEAA